MYNYNNVNVGDVVVARYLDFEGEIRLGMFLVFAMRPKATPEQCHLSVLKISTHARSFQVSLSSSVYRFLHYDSFVNCVDTHILSVSQVTQVLGNISMQTMMLVKKQLKNAMSSCYDQMDDFIMHGRPAVSNIDNKHRGGLMLEGSTLMVDGKPLTKEMLRSILLDEE